MPTAAKKPDPKDKWIGNVLNPEYVAFVPRDDFMQSLVLREKPPELPIEEALQKMYNAQFVARGNQIKVRVDDDTIDLVDAYIRFRNKGARLPKFSRWVTGMFKDNKEIAGLCAEAGKYQDNSGDIIVSCDLMDILRCSDTKHFFSCFNKGGGWDYMPQWIAERTPGMAIAFVNDADDGKIKGRVWLHHAKRKDNGKDVVVVGQHGYGTLSARQVGELLKGKGFEVMFNDYYRSLGCVEIEYVGCFTENVHHDVATWINPAYGLPM